MPGWWNYWLVREIRAVRTRNTAYSVCSSVTVVSFSARVAPLNNPPRSFKYSARPALHRDDYWIAITAFAELVTPPIWTFSNTNLPGVIPFGTWMLI